MSHPASVRMFPCENQPLASATAFSGFNPKPADLSHKSPLGSASARVETASATAKHSARCTFVQKSPRRRKILTKTVHVGVVLALGMGFDGFESHWI